MIELQGVVVRRGTRTTLDHLDLAVAPGCVYALLGGNGAGKTTTLDVLLGFVAPSAGRALVGGQSPTHDPQGVRRRLAYVPENVALHPTLSGVENLRWFCALGGRPPTPAQARGLLDDAGLQPSAHATRVAGYSKGMRQKVALAIAHARRADAMLLDEPTSGLDPAAADDLARRVRASADAGMAVLMATHDLANVLQVADRIGVLRQGRLVAQHAVATLDLPALAALYRRHAVPAPDAAGLEAAP